MSTVETLPEALHKPSGATSLLNAPRILAHHGNYVLTEEAKYRTLAPKDMTKFHSLSLRYVYQEISNLLRVFQIQRSARKDFTSSSSLGIAYFHLLSLQISVSLPKI